MKNLITGIALTTAGALMAQSPMMGAKAVSGMGGVLSGKAFGRFSISLGVSALMSRKSITTTTTMITQYNAAYLYAAENAPTIGQERGWFGSQGQAGLAADNLTQSPVFAPPAIMTLRVNGAVPQVAANELTVARQRAGLHFLLSGKLPDEWVSITPVTAGGAPLDIGVANAGVAAVINNPTWRQMMLAALSMNGQAASTVRAGVKESERRAVAETSTKYNLTSWGIRPEVRVGYRALDGVELYIGARYLFDLSGKDSKNNEKKVNFVVQKVERNIKAQDPQVSLKKVDLIRASFAYNNAQLATGVTIKTQVTETVSFYAGFKWRPVPALSVFGIVGLKRYAVEVSYKGGDYAYPGTVGMFTDTYTKANGRYKLLISRQDTTRSLKATVWPFTFGGGLSVVLGGVHNMTLGLEYASFVSEIRPENSTENDDMDKKKVQSESVDHKEAEVQLQNPYDTAPEFAQWQNGSGIHQFTATEVVNSLSAKVDVCDFTVTAGYMLTL